MSLLASLLTGTLVTVLVVAGLALLALSLFHVRYDLAWFGIWTGGVTLPHEKSVRIEFGFPGFMRVWTGDDTPAADERPDSTTQPNTEASAPPRGPERHEAQASVEAAATNRMQGGFAGGDPARPGVAEAQTAPDNTASARPGRIAPAALGATYRRTTAAKKPGKDPNKYRKALFHFVTNGKVWKALLLRYGFGLLGRAVRLLHARVEFSAGHPDPAFLGRMAGHWYALSPFLPLKRATMNFRFQDRHPSFGARAAGGFSLLSLLWFFALALLTIPVFHLGRYAWHGWRQRKLTGWRAWAYRKIQAL
jgi:hypothetical protein